MRKQVDFHTNCHPSILKLLFSHEIQLSNTDSSKTTSCEATLPKDGFTCLKYLAAPIFLPADRRTNRGKDRVCRGALTSDNSPEYYTVLTAYPKQCQESLVETLMFSLFFKLKADILISVVCHLSSVTFFIIHFESFINARMCMYWKGCVGIEYNNYQRCEIWTRPNGIGSTVISTFASLTRWFGTSETP